MRRVLQGLCCLGLVIGFASFVLAADQSWTGQISDSMCGASHAKMTATHKMTDAQCTAACVKAGAKYVFVMNGKVYSIANQDFANLSKEPGRRVTLTGSLSGDTITVSKIVARAATKKTSS